MLYIHGMLDDNTTRVLHAEIVNMPSRSLTFYTSSLSDPDNSHAAKQVFENCGGRIIFCEVIQHFGINKICIPARLQKILWLHCTPWKIHMEHNHGGGWNMVILRFHANHPSNSSNPPIWELHHVEPGTNNIFVDIIIIHTLPATKSSHLNSWMAKEYFLEILLGPCLFSGANC